MNHVDKFNSSVKYLACVYAFKKRGTFEAEKAKQNRQKIAILISSYPTWLINKCGPFFLKYGEYIRNNEWDKLIKFGFADEKKSYKDTEDGANKTAKSMDDKIKFIKQVFLCASEAEKKKICSVIREMLSAYCSYALHIRG